MIVHRSWVATVLAFQMWLSDHSDSQGTTIISLMPSRTRGGSRHREVRIHSRSELGRPQHKVGWKQLERASVVRSALVIFWFARLLAEAIKTHKVR